MSKNWASKLGIVTLVFCTIFSAQIIAGETYRVPQFSLRSYQHWKLVQIESTRNPASEVERTPSAEKERFSAQIITEFTEKELSDSELLEKFHWKYSADSETH